MEAPSVNEQQSWNDDKTEKINVEPVEATEKLSPEALAEKEKFEAEQKKLAEEHAKNLKKFNFSSKGEIFFKNDEIYMPVTMEQLENLCNEILTAMNILSAPYYLTAEYMLQVLTATMHGLKEFDAGRVKKSYLFRACVKKISMHVSYDATKAIQDKIKAEAAKSGAPLGTFSDPSVDQDDVAPVAATPEAAPVQGPATEQPTQ